MTDDPTDSVLAVICMKERDGETCCGLREKQDDPCERCELAAANHERDLFHDYFILYGQHRLSCAPQPSGASCNCGYADAKIKAEEFRNRKRRDVETETQSQ
jgi:hypothetical protein